MRDDIERLQDILDAIKKIEKYAHEGRGVFDIDDRTQVWVVHHLEILGEAANNISSETQKAHPEIYWSKIIGMRNVLAHQYFGIDLDIVWQVVEFDLPLIKPKIETLLRQLMGGIKNI